MVVPMKELQDIISDLYDDTVADLPVSKGVIIIDQIVRCPIVRCPIHKKDETTERARTAFPFVAQAIVEGGRPTNRYVITWEVTE